MHSPSSKISSEEKEYYSLLKRVFNVLAPFYDVIALPLSRVRDEVVEFSNAKKGSKVLDVATGTGKQAFAFARKGYDVTGIDLSEAMLSVANKKNMYKNARFQVADAINLPFANGIFDVSCISFALHDVPLTIREKALKEMVRVTKPDGMVVIVDYALPKNRIGRFLIFHFIKLYESKYYIEFINSNLEGLLKKSGVQIKAARSVLFGAGRILNGTRTNHIS